jgi:uncharacterized protein (DUF2141 family)
MGLLRQPVRIRRPSPGRSVMIPFIRTGALGLAAVLFSVGSTGEQATATNVIRFKAYTTSDRGVVRCGLFREKGWLKAPLQSDTVEIHGKVAYCVFDHLRQGVYAISGFHDENKNGKLDTNFVGYPTEEYCASRNARNAFSAPSFSDAKFRFGGGRVELEARMK